MPRPPRNITAGEIYHIGNRGNDKRVIFREDADYQRFIDLLNLGMEQADITIIGFCLMSTHFHLLLRPGFDDALSTYMHCVTGRYARDLRRRMGTVGLGHVFEKRYWHSHVRGNLHLLTALRYIESNPLPAGLVKRAEDWRWSSLYERNHPEPLLISPSAVDLPSQWNEIVNLAKRDGLCALLRLELQKPRQRTAGQDSPRCLAPVDAIAVPGTDPQPRS